MASNLIAMASNLEPIVLRMYQKRNRPSSDPINNLNAAPAESMLTQNPSLGHDRPLISLPSTPTLHTD